MKVLAIDIGGTHVKILATGQTERREFPSGPKLTPAAMVAGVKTLAKGWPYDVVSIGYPGPVLHDRPVAEPHNLAPGLGRLRLRRRVRLPREDRERRGDAGARQLQRRQDALPGSRHRSRLDPDRGRHRRADGARATCPTARRRTRITSGCAASSSAARRNGAQYVADVVALLKAALQPDDIVLGGGNVEGTEGTAARLPGG